MKLKFIYVLLCSAFALIVLQSRSGGAAANNLGDRTGSPLGGATCSQCHSGGSFSPTVSITVKDASQNTVTSYTPGQSYTLEFNVSAGMGSPSGYGIQAVAVSSAAGNVQAGTMGSATTSNTQITSHNNRSYIEHSGTSSSGNFIVNWTAPASGFGTVAIYSTGLVVNGNGGTSGDQTTSSVLVNLTEIVPTTISYSQSNYCIDGIDPTPTITGTTGGTFSATPTGLTINSSTGTIDLSASTAQTYTVSYDDGTGGTSTATVTINAADDAQFTYPATFACQNSALTVSPTANMSGGTWSSSNGLSINSSSGIITPSSSSVGSYVVTHTTNGVCPSTDTMTFNILAEDVAFFPFTDTTFCQGTGPNPILSVSGTTSGFYSASPSGVTFVSALTGEININTSSVGSYLLNYISNGSCPTTASANLTIALCSGIQATTAQNSYEVFPNPNNGVFSIKSNHTAGMTDISIVDVLGKVVYTERSMLDANSIKTLNVSDLATGTYFVHLRQQDQQQTFKITVE